MGPTSKVTHIDISVYVKVKSQCSYIQHLYVNRKYIHMCILIKERNSRISLKSLFIYLLCVCVIEQKFPNKRCCTLLGISKMIIFTGDLF